jgi:hypothetical protein
MLLLEGEIAGISGIFAGILKPRKATLPGSSGSWPG